MTYTNFTIETDADGIALVTWDMPDKSMNVFTVEVLQELDAICDATTADEAVKGVVFTSGKKDAFSGGADITMLKAMFDAYEAEKASNPEAATQLLFDNAGKMSQIFRKIETCGKPFAAAVGGLCLGGGLRAVAGEPGADPRRHGGHRRRRHLDRCAPLDEEQGGRARPRRAGPPGRPSQGSGRSRRRRAGGPARVRPGHGGLRSPCVPERGGGGLRWLWTSPSPCS